MEDQKTTNKTCPVKAAKALTPRWMMEILDYDGLEIHPCRVESVEDGTAFIVLKSAAGRYGLKPPHSMR